MRRRPAPCLHAPEGERTTEVARRAFMIAAQEAGIFIRGLGRGGRRIYRAGAEDRGIAPHRDAPADTFLLSTVVSRRSPHVASATSCSPASICASSCAGG